LIEEETSVMIKLQKSFLLPRKHNDVIINVVCANHGV